MNLSMASIHWTAIITGIGTIALVVVTLIYVVLTKRTVDLSRAVVKESANERNASVMLKVFEIMNGIGPDRRVLMAAPDWPNWDKEESGAAYRVSVALEQVTFLAEMGLIDARLLIEQYAGVFLNCWAKLKPYVDDLRKANRQQRRHLSDFISKYESVMRLQVNA